MVLNTAATGSPSLTFIPTADKSGKDNNLRRLTVYNNARYVTKGSGGNGLNAVY